MGIPAVCVCVCVCVEGMSQSVRGCDIIYTHIHLQLGYMCKKYRNNGVLHCRHVIKFYNIDIPINGIMLHTMHMHVLTVDMCTVDCGPWPGSDSLLSSSMRVGST